MDYDTIKTEVDGAVGIITLNRPDSLNAFNTQMRADFVAAAAEMEANEAIRAVVLTGAGRGFCAGADLKETGGRRDKTVTEILIEEYKPGIMAIANSDKTYIAAVSGPASGIGAAYAQACDMMIMGESAYIYMAFAAIALVPDGGNTWQLVRQLGYKRAYQAILEARRSRQPKLWSGVLPTGLPLMRLCWTMPKPGRQRRRALRLWLSATSSNCCALRQKPTLAR